MVWVTTVACISLSAERVVGACVSGQTDMLVVAYELYQYMRSHLLSPHIFLERGTAALIALVKGDSGLNITLASLLCRLTEGVVRLKSMNFWIACERSDISFSRHIQYKAKERL